jgi:AmmeMemoRadiSam system protein A
MPGKKKTLKSISSQRIYFNGKLFDPKSLSQRRPVMRTKIVPIFALLVFLVACCISVVSAQDKSLTDREKQYLINLARQTLYWYLKDGTIPQPDESTLTDGLRQGRGCFVTLYKRVSGLKGCIGIFGGERPLYANVIDRSIAAATKDTRFRRVMYDELKDIKIEISVLTEPKELQFDSAKDLLAKLRPGIDGVYLITRYGQSTFIPQVWESLPDKKDFLSALCEKHRAPADTWQKDYKNITVFTYQAIVLSEEVYGRRVVGKHGAVVGKQGATILGAVNPLPEDVHYGGYKVGEGVTLEPGTIVSPDSDITER